MRRSRMGTATRTTRDAVVEIYADGACRGNPGPGGWGAILRAGGVERHYRGTVAARAARGDG